MPGDAAPPDVGDTDDQLLARAGLLGKVRYARRGLPEAARQLKEAGVELVHIRYDGCSDSGRSKK